MSERRHKIACVIPQSGHFLGRCSVLKVICLLKLEHQHTSCHFLQMQCHIYPQGNLCIHKSYWRLRVATFLGNLVMDIWKYPEEVTNERCKVKCPVKSSGDLKQAAFTASGRFPQTIILGTPSPQLGVTTGQRHRSARLQMLLVSRRQG